jgi:hypothetical protein
MTDYETASLAYQKWSILISGAYVVITLGLVVAAIWGEKIRQWLNKPRLRMILDQQTLTTHSDTNKKGWYYHLLVINDKKNSPAKNVRVLLSKVSKKGPDGLWHEHKFSGPVQVMWIWPDMMPQYLTVGPEEHSTFGRLLEDSNLFEFRLYLRPMNLPSGIPPNDPTKLEFKAVSDTAESKVLRLEIAWDGQWVQGITEMKDHLIIKEVDA